MRDIILITTTKETAKKSGLLITRHFVILITCKLGFTQYVILLSVFPFSRLETLHMFYGSHHDKLSLCQMRSDIFAEL